MNLHLTTAQVDRAVGTLLATAAGDALGAPYEFGDPLPQTTVVEMRRSGIWELGEWTDDTSMAIAIARVAATGADLRDESAQDKIAAAWYEWSLDAKDVGIQTSRVLREGMRAATQESLTAPGARHIRAAAHAHYEREPNHSGGNGSLMRTAPVAIAYLDDEGAMIEAAAAISDLTHADPQAAEACVLWCLAIRHAILAGTIDVRRGLDRLSPDRRDVWTARLDEAEANPPSHFTKNGWVVHALQGAWSAISSTPVPAEDPAQPTFRAQHLQRGLKAAVRGGRDTDTVAAIAGGLLGAAYGASAIPAAWRRHLHGWPGLHARDLVRLAALTARGGANDPQGWPSIRRMDYSRFRSTGAIARHPHDDGVWIGGTDALADLPEGVNAVVSLCRLGTDEVPAHGIAPADHLEVWLMDHEDPAKNLHLAYVLDDAARVVAALRAEGKVVLLHCVQAESRTPTIAALYGARVSGSSADEAVADIQRVLPGARPNPAFRAALRSLGG